MDANKEKIEQIEAMLADERYEEAKRIIEEAVSSKETDEETGAKLAGLGEAYLDASNELNERYLDALKQATEGMKRIKEAEMKVGDNIKLAEVRESLK